MNTFKKLLKIANHMLRKYFTKRRSLALMLLKQIVEFILMNNNMYVFYVQSSETKVIKLLMRIKGCVFIDCGAGHGLHTFRLSKNFRVVLAIEPEEYNSKVIKMTSRLLGRKNVLALPIAISNVDGFAKLYIADDLYCHTLKPDYARYKDRFLIVKTVNFGRLINAVIKYLKSIDVVKMDIQWTAFKAIRSAIPYIDAVKIWIIELEYEELTKMKELKLLFERHGYKVYQITPKHIAAIKERGSINSRLP